MLENRVRRREELSAANRKSSATNNQVPTCNNPDCKMMPKTLIPVFLLTLLSLGVCNNVNIQPVHAGQMIGSQASNLIPSFADLDLSESANGAAMKTDQRLHRRTRADRNAQEQTKQGQPMKDGIGVLNDNIESRLKAMNTSLLESAAKRPPVYLSAPKHMDVKPADEKREQKNESKEVQKASKHVDVELAKTKGTVRDESKASGLHKQTEGRNLEGRVGQIVAGTPTKKVKLVKVVKVVKVKHVASPSREHQAKQSEHQHEPAAEGYSEHGEYYDSRSSPNKGEWKFAYRRGNKQHTIERHEHGHKSKFITRVNWTDKKGKGNHLFDYNHYKYHKHQKHR